MDPLLYSVKWNQLHVWNERTVKTLDFPKIILNLHDIVFINYLERGETVTERVCQWWIDKKANLSKQSSFPLWQYQLSHLIRPNPPYSLDLTPLQLLYLWKYEEVACWKKICIERGGFSWNKWLIYRIWKSYFLDDPIKEDYI